MRQGTEQTTATRLQAAPDDGMLRPLGIKSWRGISGRPYIHLVYGLLGCPPISHGTYMLVRRSKDGRRSVLIVGRALAPEAATDLAQIRHVGARLGANEVHVCACDGDQSDGAIAFDLASAFIAVGQLRN